MHRATILRTFITLAILGFAFATAAAQYGEVAAVTYANTGPTAKMGAVEASNLIAVAITRADSIHVFAYDTNLAERWSAVFPLESPMIDDLAIDSTGRIYVAARSSDDLFFTSLIRFAPSGSVKLLDHLSFAEPEIRLPARVVVNVSGDRLLFSSVAANAGTAQIVFTRYDLDSGTIRGGSLGLEEERADGMDAVALSDGGFRILGTFASGDSTVLADIVLAVDDSPRVQRRLNSTYAPLRLADAHEIPAGELRILTIGESLHGAGGALHGFSANGEYLWEKVTTIDGTRHVMAAFRDDGGTFVISSDDLYPRAKTLSVIRFFDAGGTQRWLLGSGQLEHTIISGIGVVALDPRGNLVTAGLSMDTIVVESRDVAGALRWRGTRPIGDPSNNLTSFSLAAGAESAYLLADRIDTAGNRLHRLMKFAHVGPLGVDDDRHAVANAVKLVNVAVIPNPSFETTTIRFATSRAANVSIELFAATGERIATIANDHVESGDHVRSFSARNAKIPAGAYVLRISVGGEVRAVPVAFVR